MSGQAHTAAGPRIRADDLLAAVEERAFELHYRPVANIASGQVSALEVNLRWRHPDHGTLGAEHIATQAIELGVVHRIDEHVVTETCARLGEWSGVLEDLTVWVTVSGRLGDPETVDRFCAAVAAARPSPGSFGIEVPAHILDRQDSGVLDGVATIRGAGVRIAVDDVDPLSPPGGSFLALGPDTVKLRRGLEFEDRSVHDFERLSAGIDLLRSVGCLVQAKGVESAAALERAAEFGVEAAQGSIIGRPESPVIIGMVLARVHEMRQLGRDAGDLAATRGHPSRDRPGTPTDGVSTLGSPVQRRVRPSVVDGVIVDPRAAARPSVVDGVIVDPRASI